MTPWDHPKLNANRWWHGGEIFLAEEHAFGWVCVTMGKCFVLIFFNSLVCQVFYKKFLVIFDLEISALNDYCKDLLLDVTERGQWVIGAPGKGCNLLPSNWHAKDGKCGWYFLDTFLMHIVVWNLYGISYRAVDQRKMQFYLFALGFQHGINIFYIVL